VATDWEGTVCRREAGGVAALTAFTLMCAKDSTMHLTLAAHHMLGTVKEVACAVAKLAQDSEEGQYSFATQMHFIPSLFKLLTVEGERPPTCHPLFLPPPWLTQPPMRPLNPPPDCSWWCGCGRGQGYVVNVIKTYCPRGAALKY
jgi:hypothetical protein